MVAQDERLVRYQRLLDVLAQRGLDGLLLPHNNAYFTEELPVGDEQLAWLTGFTGSAGLAFVHRQGSHLFVDGRYTLQAAAQVHSDLFTCQSLVQPPPAQWFKTFPAPGKIGFYPWRHTQRAFESLKHSITANGGDLVPLEHDLIDRLWTDKPVLRPKAAYLQSVDYAGESAQQKCQRLAAQLHQEGLAGALITEPTAVNWLLNLRGGDVAHTPLVLCRALLTAEGTVELFVDERKVDGVLARAMGNFVQVKPEAALLKSLTRFHQQRLRIHDPSVGLTTYLAEHDIIGSVGDDPAIQARVIKNETEIEGMRQAHLRDGVALVQFLSWLERQSVGELSELAVAEKLLELRQQQPLFVEPSFPTIAGFGPNGAIVHYRATPDTNRKFDHDNLLLLDSGGQYRDGTTDITRTLAIGEPSPEQRRRFSQVLMAHIGLASACFPPQTSGAQLDALARSHLWQVGLDYEHGTGHGVGCFLGVHEGPIGLSSRSTSPLDQHMILSNEPGYYATGQYGIRIENLQLIVEADPIGERPMLTFEPLSMCPIDRRLIDLGVLTLPARHWVNAYHRLVYQTLAPHLVGDARHWLDWATRSL